MVLWLSRHHGMMLKGKIIKVNHAQKKKSDKCLRNWWSLVDLLRGAEVVQGCREDELGEGDMDDEVVSLTWSCIEAEELVEEADWSEK